MMSYSRLQLLCSSVTSAALASQEEEEEIPKFEMRRGEVRWPGIRRENHLHPLAGSPPIMRGHPHDIIPSYTESAQRNREVMILLVRKCAFVVSTKGKRRGTANACDNQCRY